MSESIFLPPNCVTKPKAIEELMSLDTSSLVSLVQRFPENYWEWQNSIRDNNYREFGATEHIILRFVDPKKDPRCFYSKDSWKVMANHVLPYMDAVSKQMGIDNPVYPKAMFARLKAGGKIANHIDSNGISHKYAHKIHIPVISNADVAFFTDGQQYFLEPGKAYEVNNLVKHGVDNSSEFDRIHFIFEIFNGIKSN